MMRPGKCCAVVVFAVLALSAPAAADTFEAPGWQLAANTYPTNLVKGVDEVQEVATISESGSFTLGFEGQETGALAFGASDAEVQEALEALSTIGSGNVSVNEGAGGAPSYAITFTGLLGNMQVPELVAGGAAAASVATVGAASGTVAVDVFNVGAGPSKGTITVTDTLPRGVKAKQAGQLIRPGEVGFGTRPEIAPNVWDCVGNGPGPAPSVAGATVVTCTSDPEGLHEFMGGGGLPTEQLSAEMANPQPIVAIAVEAEAAADEPQHTSCTESSPHCNRVTIAGGGAAEAASTEDPITISSKPAPGGLTSADAWFSNADGTIDRQAGSHPYTATFVFNLSTALNDEQEGFISDSEIRDLETQVPPGLVGDLHNMPQCRESELIPEHCPPSSMVGALSTPTFTAPIEKQVFNMVPPPGEPAELGYVVANTIVRIFFSVRSGSDYGIVAHVEDIAQRETYQSILTLWGVPEEASHNRWRGPEGGCTQKEMEEPVFGVKINYCARQQQPVVQPILTLPTACGVPQPFVFRELSGWQDPDATSEIGFLSHDASGALSGFTGCEDLAFEPAITTTPDTSRSDSPSGLIADVRPPIGGLEEPRALATADIQNTTVTLPEDLVVNPGQAAGLTACGPAEDALTTQVERESGQENDKAASCPPSSKIGTVTIRSPLVESATEKQFEGNVYVLQSNPPEIKLLVAASADGVNVKFVGVVHLNEQTGQLTTKFDGTPQLPFSDFKLDFEGGAKAALDTPTYCGTYTTDADFTPWSSPFASDFLTNASFTLNSGPAGAPCPSGPLPFAPSMTAGTSTNQAGGFASFSTLLQRGDGTQRLESFRFTSPAGLAGLISTVPLCPEPQAAAGTCASSSHIGHAIVSSGPGANPLTIPQPGEPEAAIYLTGPYKGAPFGLSILTPVIAGPFNLGTIVTRAKIEVDPTTARVTVTTDPLPQIVKGVPTDLRSVYAVIDRPGFFFNPTNCESQQFTGSATSAGGAATAPISSSFGIDGCRGLTFAPKFSASTQGNGLFNRNGASLNVKISTKQGPQSNPAVQAEANIKKVDVQLPIQLPSRLTTLQKACTEKQFATNPAGCPEASNVGTAVVHTPVLPGALTGPAYLVSHGSAAFPDLDLILQGDGVTILLTGTTDIKKGITFSRFDTTPDAPISSFELNLPERKFSALAANGNLCKPTTTKTVKKRVAVRRHGRTVHVTKSVKQQVAAPLSMPTTITAQNGAVVTQTTKIAVTGCAKAKAKAKKKVKKAKRKAGKRKG
jgi:hypothetical protein